MGEILGVSGQTIYKYENGVTFPSAEMLEKILQYFKINPNTLFKYESNTDDYLEEIKNLLENHKRLYHELAYFTVVHQENVIEKLMEIDAPELVGKYSQENVLEFQRFLLLENIRQIILQLEKDSFEQGSSVTNE